MEYDPIKDKLFQFTKRSITLREMLFFAVGHVFLREQHVKRRIKQLKLPKAPAILDAGCGLGQYSLWMAKHYPAANIFAADVKQHFLDAGNDHAKARGYKNLQFGELDLLQLSETNKYDLIVSVDVMEHIEDDVDLMRRYFRALKPGGFLIIHTPGSEEDSRTTTIDPKYQVDEHVRPGYCPQEMDEKLREAGFPNVTLYPTYHKITGKLLWYLWQGIPLQLTRLSLLGYALIPLYFVVAYPLGYPLWWRDLHLPLKEGSGLIAIGNK